MKASTILTTETDALRISSLPSRPTAPKAFGGGGMSSSELRAAFDALSLLIIQRYNALLSDISSGELAEALVVNRSDRTTLADIYDYIKSDSSSFSALSELESIKARLKALEDKSNE